MWSLRQRQDDSFYLTFDTARWRTNNFRGIWELVGRQGMAHTDKAVKDNHRAGLLCCEDDEGGVRVLIYEELYDYC